MEAAWLESLVLELPDAVVVADAAGILVWGNPAAQSLFGVTNDEIVGRSALELLHPEDQEIAIASLESVRGKAVGTPIELRVKASGGLEARRAHRRQPRGQATGQRPRVVHPGPHRPPPVGRS